MSLLSRLRSPRRGSPPSPLERSSPTRPGTRAAPSRLRRIPSNSSGFRPAATSRFKQARQSSRTARQPSRCRTRPGSHRQPAPRSYLHSSSHHRSPTRSMCRTCLAHRRTCCLSDVRLPSLVLARSTYSPGHTEIAFDAGVARSLPTFGPPVLAVFRSPRAAQLPSFRTELPAFSSVPGPLPARLPRHSMALVAVRPASVLSPVLPKSSWA